MYTVGIVGGSASGKTTFVKSLSDLLTKGKFQIISQDNYYKDLSHLTREERKAVNFDHPEAIDFDLLVAHIQMLNSGETIEQPTYDFKIETRTAQTKRIEPTPLLILEGILLMQNQKLKESVDFWIFLDTDDDIRLIRRLERDMTERGHQFDFSIERYLSQVKPMYESFVYPQKKQSNLVISTNTFNPSVIKEISKNLTSKICENES
ncbi:MAG: uridine kinase [Flavobacteriaceae bacterium]|nr:uridine kinase [Flavobacteriaceae bacterium]